MADIFVSYRRDDSQWPAGRINERLEAVFGGGRVFFDTITIRPGEDFHKVLGDRVGRCRVLLAVIGPRWLDLLEARLGEDNDFVRIEIAEGLERKVRVIPILIDGARPPPSARLPDDLKALARLNAIPVRADTFRSDLDQLIGFLKEFLDRPADPQPQPPPSPPRPKGPKTYTKGPRKLLVVLWKGEQLPGDSATDVYVGALRKIGLERVAHEGLTLSGAPLVSRKDEAPRYFTWVT